MTAIIVVEPNALLRLGILQLFQKLAAEISCDGVDYTQLFSQKTASDAADLMLLSAPETYEQTAELIQAGQNAYNPSRILLLSEGIHPDFALHSLSPRLAGYVSKRSPTAMLTAAINLVLAGGTCFPNPDTHLQRPAGSSQSVSGAAPRRRWYERPQPLPHPSPPRSRQTGQCRPPAPPLRRQPHPMSRKTTTPPPGPNWRRREARRTTRPAPCRAISSALNPGC